MLLKTNKGFGAVRESSAGKLKQTTIKHGISILDMPVLSSSKVSAVHTLQLGMRRSNQY